MKGNRTSGPPWLRCWPWVSADRDERDAADDACSSCELTVAESAYPLVGGLCRNCDYLAREGA